MLPVTQKNIIDDALSIALFDLERRGLPKDDACIALMLKLRTMISEDVMKVFELLSEDEELNASLNAENQQENHDFGRVANSL